MKLHLSKIADGYAIVTRRSGPYSDSPPIEDVVLALTQADIDQFTEDMRPPTPPVEPPVVPPAGVHPPAQENT